MFDSETRPANAPRPSSRTAKSAVPRLPSTPPASGAQWPGPPCPPPSPPAQVVQWGTRTRKIHPNSSVAPPPRNNPRCLREAQIDRQSSADGPPQFPPYFPSGTGIEGDHPQKIACRFEMRGDIADYCTVAAKHLALGGFFACVFPNEQLERAENAAQRAELTIVRRRPVILRAGNEPL